MMCRELKWNKASKVKDLLKVVPKSRRKATLLIDILQPLTWRSLTDGKWSNLAKFQETFEKQENKMYHDTHPYPTSYCDIWLGFTNGESTDLSIAVKTTENACTLQQDCGPEHYWMDLVSWEAMISARRAQGPSLKGKDIGAFNLGNWQEGSIVEAYCMGRIPADLHQDKTN